MTEIILTSSVLILLLIVLRWALRGRINPVLQYALWLLAAVRLLVPGTIFQTPLSVVGAAEKLQSIQAVAVTGVEGDGYIDPARPDGPTANFVIQPADGSVVSLETQPAGPEPPKNDGPTAAFVTLPPEARNTLNWLDLIWKTGIAVTGGILAVSNLLFYVKLRKNRKLLELPQADYAGNLKVYQMDGLPSPCLFGLVKPAIYLNERAMFSGRLDHILTHEYTHYRHGDHFWAVLRSVCLAVHWYNPLVWWAAVLSRRDCELACDEAAIRRLGEDQRIDYGQTLLGMVAKRSPASLLHTATTMTAGKRAMKERIALIAKAPQMRKITILAVVLALFLLISCAFGGAAQAPSEPASIAQEPAADLPVSSVPEPAEPDALSAALARLHELESEETIGYNFSSKFGAPANGGYKPEDILPVLEKAFRDCQWTIAEEHPPTEYIVGDIRESSLDLMDQYPYWQKVTIGCFTFFDGHPYVLCYNGEGYDWYCVPEGWITVQSALMSDWYQSGQKYGYLYQEARDIWRSFQNGWLWKRYSGKFEDEQGTWYSVGFFESIEDMRGYLQTLFVPEVAEELLNMQSFCDHDGHLCVLDPPEAPGNIYAGGESYSYSILSPEDQEKYGYTGLVTAYTEVLDEDLETVLGEASWTFRFKWNGTHNVFLNFGPIDDIDPEFFHNGEYIVEQYIQDVSPREWISRLANLNWQDVGKAAVAAGLDTGDGTLGVVEVMWAVSEYIRDHGEDLTGSDYLAILTATEGLDGAPAESYEMLVYRLYAADPKCFAQVVLQELPQPPDPSQNTILNFLRHEWVYHQDPPMQEINLPGMKKVLQDLLAGTEGEQPLSHDASAPGEPSFEETNAWQRTLAGFVLEIPAMPDQELAYDGTVDQGLESAVLEALNAYYQDYVQQNGNSSHNDRFSRIILESAVPEFAEYREQVAVSYRVECLSDREWNGTTYPLAPQTGDLLTTTFTVRRLGGTLTFGPPFPYSADVICSLSPGTITGNWSPDAIRQDIMDRTAPLLLADEDLHAFSIAGVEFLEELPDAPDGGTAAVSYTLWLSYDGAEGYNYSVGPLDVEYSAA